ncbi:MAG: DUF1570 domain-containing protein [Planctomycetaceae bacterium]
MTIKPKFSRLISPPVTHGLIYLLLSAFLAIFISHSEAALPRSIEEIRYEHEKLQEKAASYLTQLSQELEQAGQSSAAEQAAELAQPVQLALSRVSNLPREMQPELDKSLPEQVYHQLQEQREFNETHANRLYILARRASKIGYPTYAYGLIQEVLRFNPDHQISRKIMGFERHQEEWLTPFEKRMLEQDYVEHELFGWIRKAHVDRYEQGERYYHSRWISAAREQELRRDLKNSWTIESEHFVLKTNHSLEKGVEISRKLELFHRFFYQTFHAFFTTPQQMDQLFENSSRSLSRSLAKRHQVFYFQSKDEYVSYLMKKIPDTIIDEQGQRIPKVSITNGLYLTADRTSYFFYDPDARDDSVIYHEATHQIFFESAPRRRQVAEEEHFWLMEGIACYMESFRQLDDNSWTVGNILHDRFYAARVRYLEDEYYIPMQEFSGMSMYQFQGHPRMKWNYSQASGLAHFFMHYDNGRYRDALIEHLIQIYNAAGYRPGSVSNLAQLTESSYEELDRQYDEYIHVQDEEEKELLKQRQFNAQVKDIE